MPESTVVGSYDGLVFIFFRNCWTLFQSVFVSTAVHEYFSFFASSPAFRVFAIFYCSRSDRCPVVAHYGNLKGTTGVDKKQWEHRRGTSGSHYVLTGLWECTCVCAFVHTCARAHADIFTYMSKRFLEELSSVYCGFKGLGELVWDTGSRCILRSLGCVSEVRITFTGLDSPCHPRVVWGLSSFLRFSSSAAGNRSQYFIFACVQLRQITPESLLQGSVHLVTIP